MEAGEILLKKGLLDQRQLELSRGVQSEGARLDQVAVDLGFLSEEDALRALGEEVHLDFVDLAETEVDLTLLKNFPAKFIHRETLFPVRQNNGTLTVATSDPFNLYPLDELSAATGLTIVPVLASRAEIAKLIKTHLGVGSETVDGLLAQTGDEAVELLDQIETDGSELSEMAQEPSVVRLVNEILLEAIELRASDVHIESQQHGLRHPLPDRRHAARAAGAAGDQPLSGRDHQPPEDHGPAEHRRAAAAAGRPHPAARCPAARSTSASRSSP